MTGKDIAHVVYYRSEGREVVSVPRGGNSWNRIYARFTNATRRTAKGFQYKIEPESNVTRVWQGDSQNGWRDLPTMGAEQSTQVSILLQRVPGRMPARDQLESDGRTWKTHTMLFSVRDDQGQLIYQAIYYVPIYLY